MKEERIFERRLDSFYDLRNAFALAYFGFIGFTYKWQPLPFL